jgi:hypothetical protein
MTAYQHKTFTVPTGQRATWLGFWVTQGLAWNRAER